MTTARARIPVALLVLLPQLWIFQGGGWNQNSRFALARALVTRGSLRIDGDAAVTGDLALRGGHVYSDKVPGVAFGAAAALLVAGPVAAALGLEPDQAWWWRAVPYAVTVLSVSIPVALTAGVLYEELAALFGAAAALLAIAAVFLASPVLGYAGLLYGHALAGCALALGWVALRRGAVEWAGFAAGVAILLELTAALGALALFAYAASLPALRPRLWRGLAAGLPPLLLLAAYDTAAFGSPLSIGYANLPPAQFEGMGKGLFGVHLPRPRALWQLTFGVHRGLFRFSPVLLLAFAGARDLARRDALFILGLFAAFLLVNAGYVYWDGHASFGPRHAVPGLVLLCVPIAAAARRWSKLSLLLLLPSLLICGLAWATRPEAAPMDWDPLQDSWLHLWRHGAVASSILWFNARDALDYRSGFSLPMLLGLDGRASLLPLLPIAAALLAWWRRAAR